jgi:archaellum component FlaF (FlaF/FlaG flagellin family)
MKNFIGQDGFVWWIGVVEDVNDPLKLGRCKVRCFGYHPAKSTNQVPTEDLPFALTIHPLNTPNLYGTPRIGEWVFGFFLDSMSAQEPAILGYLPAIPQAAAEYFGTKPSLTRNFANVADTRDVLWDVNNASIRIANNSNITIQSSNNTVITSTKNLTLTGNNSLTFSDSKNTTTLDALLLRVKAIENRLNAPTKTLVPNTSITVITNI